MAKGHLNCLTTAEWQYGHIYPGTILRLNDKYPSVNLFEMEYIIK